MIDYKCSQTHSKYMNNHIFNKSFLLKKVRPTSALKLVTIVQSHTKDVSTLATIQRAIPMLSSLKYGADFNNKVPRGR